MTRQHVRAAPGSSTGLNLGQEFVIGGFTPGPHGLDAIIVGYHRVSGLQSS
jgi:hypothetical protein